MVEEKSLVDILWVLISAGLIFIMQAGFLCLESGLTRTKNAINVAIKNLMDFGISVITYWMFGFALMFGATKGGWIGTTHFIPSLGSGEVWVASFFIFQAMFCATASTIVSGAVAERMRFRSYIVSTIIISSIIYPFFGHWAWGGHLEGLPGWLAKRGFIDFAGSTVVHSVGGWVALAILLIIGPRRGRFTQDGHARQIPRSNLPMAMLGVLLLILGWIGFNGGSTLAMNAQIPYIIANTVLSCVSGMVVALAIGWFFKRIPDVIFPMNGALAGLVSITANCYAVSSLSAVIIGAIGSSIMLGASYLLERWQIDDAIGAVPVHLAAGIWGTLAVSIFGRPEILATGLGRVEQFQVQVLGIAVCALFSFGIAYLLLFLLNRFLPLRVTFDDEQSGLNVSEHNATTELVDLLMAMEHQEKTKDFNYKVPVEPFTEVGQIAKQYNRVIESLQEMVGKTNSILNNISNGIITFASDGLLTSCNPAVENIFGISSAEIIGKPFPRFISSFTSQNSSDSSPIFENSNIDELLGEKIEVEGTRKDGSNLVVEVIIDKSKGKEHDKPFYTGIVRDITDRKTAEEQLHKLSIIPEQSPSSIVVTDIKGNIEYVNPKFSDLTGYSSDEVMGKNPRILKSGKTSQEEYAQLWETITSGAEWHGEFHNRKKSGELFWEAASISPIKDQDGNITNFIAIKEDITERKRMEDELRETNSYLLENESKLRKTVLDLQTTHKELREAHEQMIRSEKLASIGHLAAGVAHEINNPVGFIGSNIQTLEEYISNYLKILRMVDNLKQSIKEKDMKKVDCLIKEMNEVEEETNFSFMMTDMSSLIEESRRGIERIKKIVLDLRTFSREDKGETENCKIEEIIESILGIIHNEIKYKAELKKNYSGLPLVKCNAQKLGQVFMNLIVNASHAIEEKGEIKIKTYQKDNYACIDVSDTGPGIPKEQLQRIFDPFFTTKPIGKGTGLGLSICSEIVKNHNGEIKVESMPGKGTTFTVMLPIS